MGINFKNNGGQHKHNINSAYAHCTGITSRATNVLTPINHQFLKSLGFKIRTGL